MKNIIIDAEYGNLSKVKEFIKAGTNINAKDNYGNTALIRASISGKINVLKELIKAGAFPFIGNKIFYLAPPKIKAILNLEISFKEDSKKQLIRAKAADRMMATGLPKENSKLIGSYLS